MSERKQTKNTMFGGVAILAAGIAIVKVIGALFKIPLFNVLGEKGTADFNNAYSIYALLLTIATAGLPVALSKTVAECNALGKQNQKQKVFRVALSLFLTMGLASFVLMWFFADNLAMTMGNSYAALGIKALAPAVVCVGFLAAFRGYAQGHMNMAPTSISQIIEALCKLVLGLGLAMLVLRVGLPGVVGEAKKSYAAAGAITGVTIGTILAVVYMAWEYLRGRRRTLTPGSDKPETVGRILAKLLLIALPITLSTSIVPLINAIDTALVQRRLQELLFENTDRLHLWSRWLNPEEITAAIAAWRASLNPGQLPELGLLTEQAANGLPLARQVVDLLEQFSRTMYGSYSAATSLYNLPSSFMTALTAAIIPAVSAALVRGDRKGSAQITGSVLRITALLGVPMGVGLLALSGPIMRLLYPKYDVTLTGPTLAILGPAAVCVCLVLVCNAVLQANGHVWLPIATTLLGGAAKLCANYLLVSVPEVHVFGAPIGTLLCYLVVLVLDLIALKYIVPEVGSYLRVFAKPVFAGAVMGGGAWAVYGLAERVLTAAGMAGQGGEQTLSRMGNAVAVFGAIGVAVILYFALVLLTRAISKEDLLLMPKGEKIAKILHF